MVGPCAVEMEEHDLACGLLEDGRGDGRERGVSAREIRCAVQPDVAQGRGGGARGCGVVAIQRGTGVASRRLTSVDLPDPEGPSTTTTSPRLTLRSMSLRTCRSPKCLFTPSSTTRGSPRWAVMSLCAGAVVAPVMAVIVVTPTGRYGAAALIRDLIATHERG